MQKYDRFWTEQLIYRHLKEKGAITVKECSDLLKCEKQEAYFELERMVRRGRLKKIVVDRINTYFPTKTGFFR